MASELDRLVDRVILTVCEVNDGADLWLHTRRDPGAFRRSVAYVLSEHIGRAVAEAVARERAETLAWLEERAESMRVAADRMDEIGATNRNRVCEGQRRAFLRTRDFIRTRTTPANPPGTVERKGGAVSKPQCSFYNFAAPGGSRSRCAYDANHDGGHLFGPGNRTDNLQARIATLSSLLAESLPGIRELADLYSQDGEVRAMKRAEALANRIREALGTDSAATPTPADDGGK